jgi:group I intron endonuclease
MDRYNELKNIILENEEDRYCEIYKITNKINNKIYIGQAVSHILNHKKYRPYGHIGRFKCHISEAFSNKKNQCQYLNNSIKKYGKENFNVEILEICEVLEANDRENHWIVKLNSIYPYGYNLNSGGKQFVHTNESKKRVSEGNIKFYSSLKEDKLIKFSQSISSLETIDKYLRPLNRNKNQYGWYLYFGKNKKIDFGGVHIDLETSKNNCINFFNNLKSKIMAKHLDAGNALESESTTLVQ